MITNIVVHPKGATHFQEYIHKYFLKCVDGVWLFRGQFVKCWIKDEALNHMEGHDAYLRAKAQLISIR